MKNCQFYVFELILQALREGIPFAWCLSRDRKEEGGLNEACIAQEHEAIFFDEDGICFPG